MARDRPARPHLPRGKWTALALAIAVNLVFLGVLVFSVSWQNRPPLPVAAELYAPPPKAPVVETPPPPPKPEPRPEPTPEPKVEPPPQPRPAPPEPKPAPPDPDIALKAKAKAEAERKEREQQVEQERKREQERKLAEAKKQEEQRQTELRERRERDLAALRAQAEREAQQRKQAERQAERERALLAMAEAESRERARERAQQAAAAANAKALADWTDRIRAKVRSNVVEPPDLAGNPEAVFLVVLLPTGEVLDVKLRKSSGVRAYDDAVSRAILKSSPLPKPERAEVFERTLELRFRPKD